MGISHEQFANMLAANPDLDRRNPHLGRKLAPQSPATDPKAQSATTVRPEPESPEPAASAAKARLRLVAAGMSEAQLQSNVRKMAHVCGWKVYHTRDSRRSDEGFPDLVFVRKNRVLFVELKSEKGKPTQAQIEWLHALMLTRRVETYLWRPSDWLSGTIEGVLR